MSSFFEHIKQLYCEQLYSNLVQLLNIILPQIEKSAEIFGSFNEYQVLLYYGEALYRTKNYRKAERVYHKALSLKKNAPKNKRKSQSNGSTDMSAEIDIKYHIHLCYVKLHQFSNAAIILESIPQKQRTARINMALGDIYRIDKNVSAINCYKDVLKESPFALSAIINLIKMNVKPEEILNIINSSISSVVCMSWLTLWIAAQSKLNTNLTEAIEEFKKLHENPNFKDNVEIIISLAEAIYYNGEYKRAIHLFKKAYSTDPLQIRGLDSFAACLAKDNQLKELENLSNQMIQRCESYESSCAEPWIVLSYYCFLSNKKESKALFFAQKACMLSNNSVEALLLKGTIMSEAKNQESKYCFQEAKSCFQEAYTLSPSRFDTIKCMIDVHLAEKQKSAAANIANMAIKQFGQTPKTLTLLASVLLTDSVNNEKKNAKIALEKAVKTDPSYLNAVFLLSNLYIDEKNIDKAIEILIKAIECSESNVKLHKILSECYSEKNEQDKALHHKNIASKLEVNFRNSNETSQRLEHQSHMTDNIESTLELEVDDIPPSDEDVDESETDVVWSDDNYSVT